MAIKNATKSDRWAADKIVGDKNATTHVGYHEGLGLYVDWKRGPRGQGWHYRFGSFGLWQGSYKTSEEAFTKAKNRVERENNALMKAAAPAQGEMQAA